MEALMSFMHTFTCVCSINTADKWVSSYWEFQKYSSRVHKWNQYIFSPWWNSLEIVLGLKYKRW